MQDSDLIFSKIVALPNPTSWSQVYTAGKLFAVLSLKKDNALKEADDSLNIVGKNFLDKLEEEFFTLETKNLASIRKTIVLALEKIPSDIFSSFAIGVFNENILYLFAKSGGRVLIKRSDKAGTILESDANDSSSISSSSGPIDDKDLIILATKPFLDVIDTSSLLSSLDNFPPPEIAETFAPKVHEKNDGGSAALIVQCIKKETFQQPASEKSTLNESIQEEKIHYSFLKKYLPLRITHSKKIFLTVAIVILIILASSIYFAVKKQNDTKNQALFEEIYASALKKYDEGNSLLDLNKSLATDSLKVSKNLLNENKNKFSYNSKEQNEILALLKKVDKALVLAISANQVKAKEVNADTSFFLKTQIDPSATSDVASANGPKVALFAQDDNNVYFLDNSVISSVDKKTNKKEVIIKNDSHWKNPGGISAYLGNIYVLDPSSRSAGSGQILKFVEVKDGFTKTNYFTDSTPDLSNASSMTIDGSIWILFKDGSIQKFTKGKKDSFTMSGFKESFSNPIRIFTNVDTKNLYILDSGKASIVVFGKDGVYQSQYQGEVLKGAKDFEVLESSKKIYILSQDKVYQIELR